MASDTAELTEMVVISKSFRYYQETPSTTDPDKTVLRMRIARRGDKITLRDPDLRKGEVTQALITEEEYKRRVNRLRGVPEDEGEESSATEQSYADEVKDLDLEDTVEWLETRKPTIPQTVAAADGDAEVAERLLEAEQLVTGRDARQGAIDGLQKIIDSDNE